MLKTLLLLAPFAVLLLPRSYAALAPALGAVAGLLAYTVERDDPPRAFSWGATIVGIALGWYLAGSVALLVGAMALCALFVVEFLAQPAGQSAPARGVCLATGGVLLLASVVVAHGGSTANALGEARRIVVFGDSLAAGVSGDGVATLWPALLAEELGGEAINFSYPGDTAGQSYDRWRTGIERGTWKSSDPDWKADLFVIELGGNDIQRGRGAAALEADLKTWARALEKYDAPILFIGVPGAIIADPYSKVWENVESETGAVFLPRGTLRTVFTTPKYTLGDGIHFNQLGHEYFAAQLARYIREGN